MGHRYWEIAFTEAVQAIQHQAGSRDSYARMATAEPHHHRLGPNEARFIEARDSLYMATVSETGWPYVQHRGGPEGFVRVLDESTIGFADFRGNRQYVSVGNLLGNDRVALFLMDYASRTRLKLLGRARVVASDGHELLHRLRVAGHPAHVERGLVIAVEAFDWNCSQHITPRFTPSDTGEQNVRPLVEHSGRRYSRAGLVWRGHVGGMLPARRAKKDSYRRATEESQVNHFACRYEIEQATASLHRRIGELEAQLEVARKRED